MQVAPFPAAVSRVPTSFVVAHVHAIVVFRDLFRQVPELPEALVALACFSASSARLWACCFISALAFSGGMMEIVWNATSSPWLKELWILVVVGARFR